MVGLGLMLCVQAHDKDPSVITDLHEKTFPDVYQRFVVLFPNKPWIKRVQDLDKQAKANPLSKAYLEKDNQISYGLTEFDKGGMSLIDSEKWPSVMAAMSFAGQVISLSERGDASTQALLGRAFGAIKDPDIMRGLLLELHSAVNLHRRGISLEWQDESGGQKTFDILAYGNGIPPIEIECKSWSTDKGRPLKKHDSVQILNSLMQAFDSLMQPGKLLSVLITVPDKVPKDLAGIKYLAQQVAEAVTEGRAAIENVAKINHEWSSADFLQRKARRSEIDQLLMEASGNFLGTPIGYRVVSYRGQSGLAIELRSERESTSYRKMRDSVKYAIREQMTGRRPGCVLLKMEGISRLEMIQLQQEPANMLAAFANEVLRDPRHNHVTCIAFMSDQEIVRNSSESQIGQSAAYFFSRPSGRFAVPNIREIFSW